MPLNPEWTSSDRGQQSFSQLQYPEAWEYFSTQKPTLDRALNTRQLLVDQGLTPEQANEIVAEFQMAMGKNPPYRQAAEEEPYNAEWFINRIGEIPGAKRIEPMVNTEYVYNPGDRVVFEYNSPGNTGTVVKAYPPGTARSRDYNEYIFPEGVDEANSLSEATNGWTYDVKWDHGMDPKTYELNDDGQVGPMVNGRQLWPEGDVRLDMALRDPNGPKLAAKDDPDPDYSFMYYKSAIEVVPWTHNVRYREIAQRLLNKFNTRLEDGGWKDDEGEWSGGDIYVQDDGLRVEFKHLANPEIQSSALQAIRTWYDDEMREKSNIDWEMEGEETRKESTSREGSNENYFLTWLLDNGLMEQALNVYRESGIYGFRQFMAAQLGEFSSEPQEMGGLGEEGFEDASSPVSKGVLDVVDWRLMDNMLKRWSERH